MAVTLTSRVVAAAAAASAALAVSLAPAPSQARAADDGAKGAAVDQRADAEAALARVHRIFAPKSERALRRIAAAGGLEATLALRDLRSALPYLSAPDREAAAAYFKRPTDLGGDGDLDYGGVPEAPPICDAGVCVHYVTSGPHAPDPTDADANGRPDFVDAAVATMRQVNDAYSAAGYRRPKSDVLLGGSDATDIYLGDIGDAGTYGYCTSDQPEISGVFDVWAYCVLDEDYSEFPTNTPVENLQVTAAHEYFHAVQYAYDAYEDGWILEATAAWVEDEMYDGVDDNRQYLDGSPLTHPHVSMDQFIGGGDLRGWHYGVWSFFRYLSERYPAEAGGLPTIVRDIWRKLDAAGGAPDEVSLQGVASVLQARGTTLETAFAQFAEANRRSRQVYSEGAALRYPVAPLAGSVRLTPRRNAVKPARLRIDHLASASFRLSSQGWKHKSSKLRVKIDMAAPGAGSRAVLTVYPRRGKPTVSMVRLDRRGDASPVVGFRSSSVAHVEVTLVNATGIYDDCWEQPTPFTCSGIPQNDGLPATISAQAFRAR